MQVRQLIALLKDMPAEAHVTVCSDPLSYKPNFAPRQKTVVACGLSADELRVEQVEPFLFEENKIVVIAMVTNANGVEI